MTFSVKENFENTGTSAERRLSEGDYETLLDISAATARVRDRDELFRLIIDRVQPIFGFNQYANICIYDTERNTLEMFFTNATEVEQTQSRIPTFMQPFPVKGIFRRIIETDEITFHDESWKTSLKTVAIDEASAQIWRDLDFKYALSVALHSFGKLVGTFHVHFFEPQNFTDNKLRLFKAISEQIAVAVSNILANEEIIEREREKSQLLEITEAIARVQNSDELYQTIYESLRPVFRFDTVVIKVLSDDGKSFRHLNTTLPENIADKPDVANYLLNSPIADSPNELTLGSEEPRTMILDAEEMVERYKEKLPDKTGNEIVESLELKEWFFTPLYNGGKLIGSLELLATERGSFNESQFKLFENAAGQVAAAVANILANEEILEREREKTLLLSLSEDMATIRDCNDLWRVMMRKIKPLVGFDDAVVVTFQDDAQHCRHLLTTSPDDRRSHPLYAEIVGDFFAVAGTPFDYVLTLGAQYEWRTEELLQLYPNHAGLRLCRETNLEYCLGWQLRWGGELIGLLQFAYSNESKAHKNKFRLCKSIANQVAVAVANILANEEILEREQEKSVLLSISEDISAIRDKDDLFRVITEKIKPIFGFDDAVVFIADCERDSYYVFLTNTPQNRLDSEFYPSLAAASLPLRDSVEEWIVSHEKPFIFSTAQFVEKFPNAPGIRLAQEVGIKDSIIGVMRNGGKIIGSFHIHSEQANFFQESQLAIFQSVTEQLAVAVSNILANEEILEREREKSTLLSISERIAAVRNRAELFALITDEVQPLFGFNQFVGILAFNEAENRLDNFFAVPEGAQEMQSAAIQNLLRGFAPQGGFLRFLQSPEPFLTNESWLAEPLTCEADEWAAAVWRELNFKSSLIVALRSGNRVIGSFHTNYFEPKSFTENQIRLFKVIGDEIAVAVANILANEEIEQLAEECRERADELAKSNEALARTSAHLTKQPDLRAFLSQVVIEAMNQLNADAAHLIVLDEKRQILQTAALVERGNPVSFSQLAEEMPVVEAGFWQVLSETKQPRYFDLEREPHLFWRGAIEYLRMRGFRTVYSFPLAAGEKMLGVLGTAFARVEPVTMRQNELVAALAHQAALAIQLTRLADEARSKAEETAVLDERNRIAREIHDTLAQSFTGIVIQLEAGKRILNEDAEATEAHLERASAIAREGLKEARRSVQALRPLDLEQTDLATTLEQFLDRMTGGTKVRYEFSIVGKPGFFPAEIEMNFLRIGQEAVTNALRHANPTRVKVELSYIENSLNLCIADDGAGYDAKKVKEGFGLIGIRERARSIGATLKAESHLCRGTKIKVSYQNGKLLPQKENR